MEKIISSRFVKTFDISKIFLRNKQKNVKIEYLIDSVFQLLLSCRGGKINGS